MTTPTNAPESAGGECGETWHEKLENNCSVEHTPAAPQPETTSTLRLNDHPLGLQMDAPQPETEGMTFEAMPKFRNVGNGHCLYCDDVGNLHRRVDQPDGHMVCYDCSRAYRIGWTAAKGGR